MFVCLILPVSSVSPAPWSHSLFLSSKLLKVIVLFLRQSFGIPSGLVRDARLSRFFDNAKLPHLQMSLVRSYTLPAIACDCVRLRVLSFEFLSVLSVELIHSSFNNSTSASPTIPHSTFNIPHCQRQPFHIPPSTFHIAHGSPKCLSLIHIWRCRRIRRCRSRWSPYH